MKLRILTFPIGALFSGNFVCSENQTIDQGSNVLNLNKNQS